MAFTCYSDPTPKTVNSITTQFNLDIDRGIVYDVLKERLGDFGELRKTFARFL